MCLSDSVCPPRFFRVTAPVGFRPTLRILRTLDHPLELAQRASARGQGGRPVTRRRPRSTGQPDS